MTHSFSIRLERGDDSATIYSLHDIIFGEAQKVRAAYALREGLSHELPLSFVAADKDKIIATVRQTKIFISATPIFLLGPLGVHPDYKNMGIGKSLMQSSMQAAKESSSQTDAPQFVLLVGDLDYYAPFGFRPVSEGSIILPRPADPARILLCSLSGDATSSFPMGPAHSGL